MSRVLAAVCSPIYDMIQRWILEGRLDDPFGEFFIARNPSQSKASGDDLLFLRTQPCIVRSVCPFLIGCHCLPLPIRSDYCLDEVFALARPSSTSEEIICLVYA